MSEEAVDTAHPGSGDTGWEPDPHRWRILSVSLVVGFMSLLDVTIVNVAIPSMQSGLHTSAGTVQWVVSGYALAFGLTLVAGGRLGDAYGRRRLMLIGLTGFVISSGAVGLAPSAGLVIVARLVQGATAGMLTPQNSGLIQDLFRGPERGRAFGLFGFTVSVASAAGPVLGGAIIALAGEENGWRWLFLVNVPIGILVMPAVLRLVPGRAEDATPTRIDVPGAVLLGLSVLCLLYPLVSLESQSYLPLVLLAGVPGFAFAFVRWEHRLLRRDHAPLLDISLLARLPGYAGGLAVGTLYFTGFTGILLVTSEYLQEQLAATPLQAGLLITPFAVGSAITAPLAGRVVAEMGRRITLIALTVMMTGILLAALLGPGRDLGQLWWALGPALFVAGCGGGAVVSPNLTLTLADVPPHMGGAAGGAVQTGQRIGSSLGAALLVTVFQVAVDSSATTAFRAALLTSLVVLALAMVAAAVSMRTQTS